jgi:hypothetical protein
VISGPALLLAVCSAVELNILRPFEWYDFYMYTMLPYWIAPTVLNLLVSEAYKELFYKSPDAAILLPLMLFHVNSTYLLIYLTTRLPTLLKPRKVKRVCPSYEISASAA